MTSMLLTQGCSSWWGEPKPAPLKYNVVRGDTLSKIARRNHVSVTDLKSWNGLSSDLIEVDQVLIVGYDNAADLPVGTNVPTRKRKKAKKPTATLAVSDAASLQMPSPKTCLDGPSLRDNDDEPQMAASEGLSLSQVTQSLNSHVSNVSRCVDGTWPAGTIDLSFQVGCDGVVTKIDAMDRGGFDDEFVSCVQQVLRTTAFPAHALPDGDTFRYPLTFSAE